MAGRPPAGSGDTRPDAPDDAVTNFAVAQHRAWANSFADWVRGMRGPEAAIKITPGAPGTWRP